ncbi:Arginyl-tRNA synthetase [hydrothermal vent metagenome]|uniref:arginine--tRNA ligase n=1 Tax=hydrothermal vent metagenome TaxID=652676 RepID=A0A3B0ZW32_9ZZZZ
MKVQLTSLIKESLDALIQSGDLPESISPEIQIEHARSKQHGDFACNIALALAKIAKCNPRDLAQRIVQNLPTSSLIEKTEIAGPGFINFWMASDTFHKVVANILEQGDQYGRHHFDTQRSVQIEFVSANPTGPLHVGHGRGAAYGAALASLLTTAGYTVHREYYVNDAGRQMDILATSVWLRYLNMTGQNVPFPSNAYKGDYLFPIAEALKMEGSAYNAATIEVMANIPLDEAAGGDKEAHIDALIARCKQILGPKYKQLFDLALKAILTDIKEDLAEFGVHFDNWFSERSLADDGSTDALIKKLKDKAVIYEKEGALWFKSTDYGDEKDRVVVRDNGQKTYFASDIAYHKNKLQRGFETIIDVWGADHHGYIPRVKAAITATGDEASRLTVLLVQFAILYRGSEKLQMSTRSGEFVTLRQLREDVGNDAARFFYVMRKCEQHLDFDLELAKSKSNENPVYYIQYAHARICTVMKKLATAGYQADLPQGIAQLSVLKEEHEIALMTTLIRYPELIQNAAKQYEPHQVAHYLRALANQFHAYYNAHKFIVDDAPTRNARLALITATQQVLVNGLKILGVTAPEAM